MQSLSIVRGIALGAAVIGLPSHAQLSVTGTTIVARAYASQAGSPLPKTDFLSTVGAPAADATVSATDVAQFGTVRAGSFQSFGGFDAASASIKNSAASNPSAMSSVDWQVGLQNVLPIPVPAAVPPQPALFGFTIPSARMLCDRCMDSPAKITATISATLRIVSGRTIEVAVSGLPGGTLYDGQNAWSFTDTLTVDNVNGAVLGQSFVNLSGNGSPLTTRHAAEWPTPLLTISGSDVAVDYAPFSAIIDLSHVAAGEAIALNYKLQASVRIEGYGGYADVSAFIADPFGLSGETVPQVPPGAQLFVSGASVLGAVPEPQTYALMFIGLALVGRQLRRSNTRNAAGRLQILRPATR